MLLFFFSADSKFISLEERVVAAVFFRHGKIRKLNRRRICRVASHRREMRVIARSTIEIDVATIRGTREGNQEKKREQNSAPGDEDISQREEREGERERERGREREIERRRRRRCWRIEFVIKDPGRCSRGLKGCFFRAENSPLSNGYAG